MGKFSPSTRRTLCNLICLLGAAPSSVVADSQAPPGGAWQGRRPQLYGTRPIGEGGDESMSVSGPASTPDPSATPIVVQFGKELAGKVRQVRVIIDNNPSPLVTPMSLAAGLP